MMSGALAASRNTILRDVAGNHVGCSKEESAFSRHFEPKAVIDLAGWGGFPRASCQVVEPGSEDQLQLLLKQSSSLVARGNGRAYGDAALNLETTVLMRRFDRILSFDHATGFLVCEAGSLLSKVLAVTLPHGWLPPVLPGTRHVTVGGMVAADVHGKNHIHAGSFGRHVAWLDIMIGDGSVFRCSPTEERELFEATLGGMGLTGVVLRVAFALVSIASELIEVETVCCENIDATLAAFESNHEISYAVAWIDLLSRRRRGRSLLQLGNHAEASATGQRTRDRERQIRIPIRIPPGVLNGPALRALSALHYFQARHGRSFVPLHRFFFPLDGLVDWNRLYGRRGFVQCQFVLPDDAAPKGLEAIIAKLAEEDAAPFLAVLKRFGEGRGMLSFPMRGYTLAMDFPATRNNLDLLGRLDSVVADFGGRVYLAKDALSTADRIRRSYPELPGFRAVRHRVDPLGRFSSLLSKRLEL